MKKSRMTLDAGETIFFTEELNHTKARAYNKIYPELKATALFPVSFDADEADETITYETYDQVGVAKIIANYADDLPAADVKGERFTSDIRGIGTSYHYNIMEIKKAAKTGKPLKQSKANAAKRANDQKVNSIAWFGDAIYNLYGVLNNPNIVAVVAPNGGGGTPQFVTKTPDEILDDLNNSVTDTVELTNGVEIPDTLVLPIKQYAHIAKTARSATSDTTILQFFLANNPTITRVEWAIELKQVVNRPTGTGGAADCMITYKRDVDKISLEIPMAFEQGDPQSKNLAYKIPCHSRCGGIIIPYPLSVRVTEDI